MSRSYLSKNIRGGIIHEKELYEPANPGSLPGRIRNASVQSGQSMQSSREGQTEILRLIRQHLDRHKDEGGVMKPPSFLIIRVLRKPQDDHRVRMTDNVWYNLTKRIPDSSAESRTFPEHFYFSTGW